MRPTTLWCTVKKTLCCFTGQQPKAAGGIVGRWANQKIIKKKIHQENFSLMFFVLV